MKDKHKIFLRASALGVLVVLLICFLNDFFQPLRVEWNNYYTQEGFYEEPDNTIETLFIGASTMLNAVNPTQLYSDYGMCAYNLGTEKQPVLATYFWVQEVYRLHSQSLKTVVFEVSELRDTSIDLIYHKALDNMKFSFVKLKALAAYEEEFGNAMNMFPLYAYHTRWSKLEDKDFYKFSLDPVNGTRGYNFDATVYGLTKKLAFVNEIVLDEDAEPNGLVESSVSYFEKLVEFCEEKGLNLLLVKVPVNNWSSSFHNAVQNLADKHSLEFLDFNFDPLFPELEFVDLFDNCDTRHMNCYGAEKFTSWLGQYLVDEYSASDVRGNPDYAFMEDQLRLYEQSFTLTATLQQIEDVTQYLSTAMQEHTAVLIAIKDSANRNLTNEQKATLKELGLEKLSSLEYRESYIAVVEGGEEVFEIVQECDPDIEEVFTFSDKFSNGVKFTVKSGGFENGNTASIRIDGEEVAVNERGINIVVYNCLTGKVLDSAAFDTHNYSKREVYKIEYASLANDEAALTELAYNSIFQQMLERLERIDAQRH